MIVFDVTRVSTFEAVAKWKADIDAKVTYGAEERPIPVVLLANKCDLAKEGFVKTANEMDKYVKENNFLSWFETSAKDNINIDKAAKCLVAHILEGDKRRHITEAEEGTVKLDGEKDKAAEGGCCK